MLTKVLQFIIAILLTTPPSNFKIQNTKKTRTETNGNLTFMSNSWILERHKHSAVLSYFLKYTHLVFFVFLYLVVTIYRCNQNLLGNELELVEGNRFLL